MSDSRIGWYLRGTSVIHISKDGQTERAACGAWGLWQHSGNTADAVVPEPSCKRCLKVPVKTGTEVTGSETGTEGASVTAETVWCQYCPPAKIEAADMEALMPDGAIIPMCGGIMCRELSDDDGAIMYDVINGTEIRERQAEIRAARARVTADGTEVTDGLAVWVHGEWAGYAMWSENGTYRVRNPRVPSQWTDVPAGDLSTVHPVTGVRAAAHLSPAGTVVPRRGECGLSPADRDDLTVIQEPAEVRGFVIDFSGLLTGTDVAGLPTPGEAVAAVATLRRPTYRRRKPSQSRSHRKGR